MSTADGDRPVVLVADDDDDIRDLVAFRLDRAGYEVLRAGEHSVLIVSEWRITVAADGRFTYRQEGSHTGVTQFRGRAEQDGDRLRYRTDSGQSGAVRFRLSGSNGLWLDGALYERQ